jgi:HK97 family phage major capsid protein
VPEDWADQIVKSAVKEAGIAPNSRQETTGSNEKTIIVRQAIPTAAQADELGTSYSGTGYAVGNATFSQETIALHKATQSIPVSEEILTDSYFNFQNEVIDAGATAIQELVGSWLANGTGTKQPYGLFATAGTGKTTASSGTIVKADLTALKNSVKNTYRRVGKWIMNDATLGVCEAIVDSFGQSIVQERTNGEYWMLNRQIVIDENSPDIGSGTKAIAFGDLSRAYCVVTKPTGLSIKVDPYTNSSNGVTLYHFNMRVGGKIVLAEAVQVMVIKA